MVAVVVVQRSKHDGVMDCASGVSLLETILH